MCRVERRHPVLLKCPATEPEFFTNMIVATARLLRESGSAGRASTGSARPERSRRAEKRVLGLTSVTRTGVGPTPCFLGFQSALGPLTDADVTGLRRIFRERDGLLHTILAANELSRLQECL